MLPYPKPQSTGFTVFALVFLPIVAVIAIPLYAYHHDFSLAAWISMFALLGLSKSLVLPQVITAYRAHRAYEATVPLKIILMIIGTFASTKQHFVLGLRFTVPIIVMLMM